MAHAVVLPKMGMTMVEGTITEWFVTDGDTVGPADRLFSFETEKVDYEVEAESAGTIRTLANLDDTVEAGAIVAYILADGEELPADAAPPAPSDTSSTQPKPVGVASSAGPSVAAGADQASADGRPVQAPAGATAAQAQVSSGAQGTVKASPVAKRLAAENNIDLATVSGTGPGGRIVKEDVETAIAAPAAPRQPREQPLPPSRPCKANSPTAACDAPSAPACSTPSKPPPNSPSPWTST